MSNEDLIKELDRLIIECETQSKNFANTGLIHIADCSSAMCFAYQNVKTLITGTK